MNSKQAAVGAPVKALLGTKLGMTQLWDESGRLVPITVVRVGTNVVTQIRTPETDGYSAVQLASGELKTKNVTKPLQGHFDKAGVAPRRRLAEVRTPDASEYELGQELTADLFEAGQKVDVIGTSKGKGFAGVMKRHGFGGVSASHGAHRNHRKPGSIGACATPSRRLPRPAHGRPHGIRPRDRHESFHPRRRRREGNPPRRRSHPGQQGWHGRGPHRREGSLTMPQSLKVDVLDAEGAVAGSADLPAELFDVTPTSPSSTRSSPPSWPRPAREPTPPRRAGRSPAAAASPSSRRAPAGPAKARSARRSSPAAAPCTVRNRGTTRSAPRRR